MIGIEEYWNNEKRTIKTMGGTVGRLPAVDLPSLPTGSSPTIPRFHHSIIPFEVTLLFD
jgi:hypothetical protein